MFPDEMQIQIIIKFGTAKKKYTYSRDDKIRRKRGERDKRLYTKSVTSRVKLLCE